MKPIRGSSEIELLMITGALLLFILAFARTSHACTEADPNCAFAPGASESDFVLSRSLERPEMPAPKQQETEPFFDWDPFAMPTTPGDISRLAPASTGTA